MAAAGKALSCRRAGRGLLAWLALLVVLAQTQGLLHGVVHAPQGVASHAAAGVPMPAAAPANAGRQADLHWVARLFLDHEDASACRLFDQVNHADCLPGVPLLALPLQLAGVFPGIFEAPAPCLAPARVQARGPPSAR